MATTPPNTVTSAEAVARVSSTPITAKHPDRQKGILHVRNHLDGNMTNDGRYVEVTWTAFMKNYVPTTTETFDAKDAQIDLQNFAGSNEKACYPPIVSRHQ